MGDVHTQLSVIRVRTKNDKESKGTLIDRASPRRTTAMESFSQGQTLIFPDAIFRLNGNVNALSQKKDSGRLDPQ